MPFRLIILAILFFVAFDTNASAQDEIQVISMNIRYGTPGDGENKWKSRRDRVFIIFDRYKDGITATQ